MMGSKRRLWVSVGLAALMVVSAGLAALGGAPAAASHASAPAGSPVPPSGASPAATAATASASAAARASTLLSTLVAAGVPSYAIHLPDLAAMAEHPTGQVAPTYPSAPAPMGVSDLGLVNESGSWVPYEFNSTSVEGTINFTNAQSVYVDGDGPDMFGVQLNSVDAGVTVFGNASNQFWTQNFVSYTPSSGELGFGDNIWNFSNFEAYISPNVFYAHGPNGTLFAPIFYYAIGPVFTIHYPFSVTFYNNATVLDDRPAVYFNYTLSNATMSVSGSYDYVIFNSSASAPTAAAPSGEFQVDGYGYDPVGLPNDVELDLVGNDDGDTTTFYALNATESLATWNGTTRDYQPIPSAFDAGSETGETSDGVAVSWTSGSSVANLALGPSFLGGLWNLSSTPGTRTLDLTPTPANLFAFASVGTSFEASGAQWIPTFGSATSSIAVPGDAPIWLEFELSDYLPLGEPLAVAANGTLALHVALTRDPAEGVYTPLLADGNGQLAAVSSGGTGTSGDPYEIENNEIGPIAPEFDVWNDFQFPVFPGLLLIGTTAFVDAVPPSFSIVYPSWQSETIYSTGLPATNNLQLQFWNVSHVVLENAVITGWLSFDLSAFPEGAVIFWNSSGNLIAGNTFLDQGASVALYGGSNNTLWGNRFVAVAAGGSIPDEVLNYGPYYSLGVNESESGDLIYNNYFDVPLPALTPTEDPLSCQINCEPAAYVDTWNVSDQAAADYTLDLGVNLTGSILGTPYQGGNFWSIYGEQGNPYGVLPFNDSGLITAGGDSVPLVPFELSSITFQAYGLPAGTAWGIGADGVVYNTTATTLPVWGPNGTYEYFVTVPVGYTTTDYGYFTLNGTAVSMALYFVGLGWVDGAVTPAHALLTINGTEIALGSGGAYNVSLVPGTYEVYASASGYRQYYTNVSVAAEQGTALAVELTPSNSSVPPTAGTSPASGLSGEAWGIIGALAAVAVVLLIATVYFARRKAPPAPPVAAYAPPPPGPA